MRRREWIGIAVAVAALAIGYFLGRRAEPSSSHPALLDSITTTATGATVSVAESSVPSRSTTRASRAPLPPPKAPLLSVFSELKARADAGDGDAATRLFHDLESCRRVRFAQEVWAQLLAGALNEPTANKSPDELTQQDQSLDRTQKMMNFVHDNAAMCEGVGPEQVEATVPAMLAAAKSGDLPALDCYLGLEIANMPGNLIDHPEWLTQYKQNAPALIELGLQSGDWHVVKLMQFAYSGSGAGSELLDYVVSRHPDSEQWYRYQRLERLGASGDYAAQLDLNPFNGSSLSKEQIAVADAWAQDMFSRYFEGTSSNELGKWESACPDVVFY